MVLRGKVLLKRSLYHYGMRKEASVLCTCLQYRANMLLLVFFFSRTLLEICLSSLALPVRHREAMFKLVDLEAFPASRVWARPRLTSSHVAAKLKLPTKPSASPCTHISRQWAETQLSSSPFLLSPQVLLIDGRET